MSDRICGWISNWTHTHTHTWAGLAVSFIYLLHSVYSERVDSQLHLTTTSLFFCVHAMESLLYIWLIILVISAIYIGRPYHLFCAYLKCATSLAASQCQYFQSLARNLTKRPARAESKFIEFLTFNMLPKVIHYIPRPH